MTYRLVARYMTNESQRMFPRAITLQDGMTEAFAASLWRQATDAAHVKGVNVDMWIEKEA